MSDPRLGDHAIGIELRIEESVTQRLWAEREGWTDVVRSLELEIAELYAELADTAERVAGRQYAEAVIHDARTAGQLVSSGLVHGCPTRQQQ